MKNKRPTENGAFGAEVENAGRHLCHIAGVKYHPSGARYYAELIRRRAWSEMSAETRRRFLRWQIEDLDALVEIVLD